MKLTLNYEDISINEDDIRVGICENGFGNAFPKLAISIEWQSNSLWFARDLEITPPVEAFINEHFEHPANVIMFLYTTLKGLK